MLKGVDFSGDAAVFYAVAQGTPDSKAPTGAAQARLSPGGGRTIALLCRSCRPCFSLDDAVNHAASGTFSPAALRIAP